LIQIAPFKALRYNPHTISFISRVVAPPYDMIEPNDVEKLRRRDRHNAVRLILGKHGTPPRPDQAYEEAAHHLNAWRNDRVLVQDETPALYVYEQTFQLDDEAFTRCGVIGAVLLADLSSGTVLPHERTMTEPKADRLRLMTACRANLSQVFAIYSDPHGRIDTLVTDLPEGDPLFEFCDRQDIVHRLWTVSDPGKIAALAARLHGETLVIADGHHRYETAIRYRDEHRSADGPPGSAPEDFAPFLCVSVRNAGLKILPTHRLVKADGDFIPEAFLESLAERFEIERIKVAGAAGLEPLFQAALARGVRLGCYVRQQTLYLLTPRNADPLADLLPDAPPELRALAVTQLHYAILDPLFAIPVDAAALHPRLEFSQDVQAIFWAVESMKYDAAFLLPPTDADTVTKVAASGHRMPPKSTFFFPKVPSGLLFYPFEGAEHLPHLPEL